MERPANIPAEATWNEHDKRWEYGETNTDNKRTGTWQAWDTEGLLRATTDYREGEPPFIFTGYHPDGTISRQGNYYGDNTWLGTFRWIKSDNRTTETFPDGPARKNKQVWIVEFDYPSPQILGAQRYFDKNMQPLTLKGTPLPKHPATVPSHAHYEDDSWITKQVDQRISQYVGEYTAWDTKGRLYNRQVYDAKGSLKEAHQYRQGQPIISEVFLNGRQDLVTTFYDNNGKATFNIREENISPTHLRRYYNGILVYEGLLATGLSLPPQRIQYFYPDGSTLIDYASHGDGTGIWHLYDTNGNNELALAEPKEQYRNKHSLWNRFLPYLNEYESDNIQPDWENARAAFKAAYNETIVKEKLAIMVVPPFLQKELDKVDWEDIETSMYDGDKLPGYIMGILSDDEVTAKYCEELIWPLIEHQGDIYESTYMVTTILAKVLPHYTASPLLQKRVILFISEVLSQEHIKRLKKLYKDLISALQPSIDLITQMAAEKEEEIATSAKQLLKIVNGAI